MTKSSLRTGDRLMIGVTLIGGTLWLLRHRFRTFYCILTGGHHRLYHIDKAHNRVCLKCVACGDETVGWEA